MSSESLRATRPTPRSNRLPKQNRKCFHFRCHGPTDGQGVSHWTRGMNDSMTSVKLVYAISTFLPLEHAFRDPSGGAETIEPMPLVMVFYAQSNLSSQKTRVSFIKFYPLPYWLYMGMGITTFTMSHVSHITIYHRAPCLAQATGVVITSKASLRSRQPRQSRQAENVSLVPCSRVLYP